MVTKSTALQALALLTSVALSSCDRGPGTPPPATILNAALWQAVPDSSNNFPAVVRVNTNLSFFVVERCTGTLIAPDRVLTARHCICNEDNCADVGEIEIVVENGAGETLSTLEVAESKPYPYPTFTEGISGAPATGDVAILKLTEPVPGLAPIPVSFSPVDLTHKYVVVGFGHTDITPECGGSGLGSAVRRYGFIELTSNRDSDHVYADYPNYLHDESDALAIPPLPLSGDSGGPLIRKSSPRRGGAAVFRVFGSSRRRVRAPRGPRGETAGGGAVGPTYG